MIRVGNYVYPVRTLDFYKICTDLFKFLKFELSADNFLLCGIKEQVVVFWTVLHTMNSSALVLLVLGLVCLQTAVMCQRYRGKLLKYTAR